MSARVLVVSQADAVGTTQVRVTFNSPLNAATAQNVANYLIVGVNVTGALLEAGGASVLLTTSTLTIGQFYRVITNGVESNAGVVVQPNSNAPFLPGGGRGIAGPVLQRTGYRARQHRPHEEATASELRHVTHGSGSPYRNFAANSFDTTNFPTITDYFSARWTGKLKTLAAGSYTFTASFSDGFRLWFWPDGQPQPVTPIIDRWTVNSGTTASSLPQAGILADTKYNFKVEWFEGTGNAIAILRWTTPGASSTIIPASQYSQPVTLEAIAQVVSKITVASSGWTPAFVAQLQAQGLGTGGVDVPLGGTSPALPWSNVNQVKVKFDSDVVVGAGSLSVGGVNVASYGVTNFSYDYTTFTGTWTLAQPIDLDCATISVAAGVTDWPATRSRALAAAAFASPRAM